MSFDTIICNRIGESLSMQEVDEISQRYKVLLEACALINSNLDLDTLLVTIAGQAMAIMDAEAASTLIIDKNGKDLVFRAALGEAAEKLKNMRLTMGEGIAGWVAMKGESLLIPDVARDTRFHDAVDAITGFKTGSLLCVPLKSATKMLGVLEVINRKGGAPFDESDVSFLRALASQAATAIENALLHGQLKDDKNKIETIINSMADGVIVFDENTNITIMNPSAKKIFDVEQDPTILRHASPEKLTFILNEVKGLKENALFDIVLMKPENIILSNNVTLLQTPEGKSRGAVMVLRNITENKDKEIMRSQFLTLLSYKIFAPLEQLLREIESLSHDSSPEVPLRRIYDIEKSVSILKNFVQKLHYFSELEAGPLRLERSNYRLSELLEEAIMLSRDEISDLKINARIPEIETAVMVDGGRIIEALMLLVFFFSSLVTTDQELFLELTDKEENFEIKMMNPIPGELLGRIQLICASQYLIEDFCRLQTGGEGLEDLLEFAFVKHLLNAHGGDINVEEIDKKYMLVITLPKDKGD
jgi:two-component system, OmpR family, phosphate regulon sensor histidine kinase PhoR